VIESLNVVKLKSIMSKMNVIVDLAQAKFVPAAAVIRIVQVFDLMTGCKRPQRRLNVFFLKDGVYYSGV